MTIREKLNKKKRYIHIVSYTGFFIFLLGLLLAGFFDYKKTVLAVSLPGFLIFLLSILYFPFGIKCPRCGKNIGKHLLYFKKSFLGVKEIDACPYCGKKLDERLESD